jgi:hypothetical protein
MMAMENGNTDKLFQERNDKYFFMGDKYWLIGQESGLSETKKRLLFQTRSFE